MHAHTQPLRRGVIKQESVLKHVYDCSGPLIDSSRYAHQYLIPLLPKFTNQLTEIMVLQMGLFFLLFKRDPIPEFTEISCSEVQPGYCLLG